MSRLHALHFLNLCVLNKVHEELNVIIFKKDRLHNSLYYSPLFLPIKHTVSIYLVDGWHAKEFDRNIQCSLLFIENRLKFLRICLAQSWHLQGEWALNREQIFLVPKNKES